MTRITTETALTREQLEELLFPPSTPAEISAREALAAEILERGKQRNIRPLTTTDLVHLARQDDAWYDDAGH